MKGTCLCESVTIEANDAKEFEACHCGICRRWGGGPLLAVHCGADVVITGSESIKSYASSEWADRGFCVNCGTHLYYHLKHSNEYIVPLGLFQSESGFRFKQQIFIDKKPDCYDFANQTEHLTEQQVFEKFGA
ncbi:GFA family protein [Zobellella aerophila]|uniref:GFA family protein n=1 Tax=Zobellella aerophila TaxID=870480 RepID=A0ABP6V973_9GAMM